MRNKNDEGIRMVFTMIVWDYLTYLCAIKCGTCLFVDDTNGGVGVGGVGVGGVFANLIILLTVGFKTICPTV